MAKRRVEMPPGGRKNPSSGRITLMFAVVEGGTRRRLSQHKILPSEPRSYETVEEADAGWRRVTAYLEQQKDLATTVMGFWERWTDEDDAEWGAFGIETPRRSRHSIVVYKSNTRTFAEFFAERSLASISEVDVKRWTNSTMYRASNMAAIRTFLSDAATAGLRTGENPAAGATKKANLKLARNRTTRPPVPTQEQSRAMLAFAKEHMPIGLYGWLLCGVRTGMRCSELDGMQLGYLNRKTGVYEIEFQLHPRTRTLEPPKHDSRRKVLLPRDVLDVIDEIHDVIDDPGPKTYIWQNTLGRPWDDGTRLNWWDRDTDTDGQTLRSLAGGVTMKNATRHYWATQAMNGGEMSLWNAATLMGHSDGGVLIAKTYADRDSDAALEAAAKLHAKQPVDLAARRRRAA
jgi:integrase